MSYRIGLGIDFHQLVEGRDLFIGGVQILFHKGGMGHSDADVLLHAICDALLGAAGLGDIGTHFPDTSEEFKNIDSKILLKRTYELITKENLAIKNIDSTVCLEEPKVKPYVSDMKKVIAGIVNVSIDDVSIKATTTEKMGFIGRGEGIAAQAIVLLQKK